MLMTAFMVLSVSLLLKPRAEAGFINIEIILDTPERFFAQADHIDRPIGREFFSGGENWSYFVSEENIAPSPDVVFLFVSGRHFAAPHEGDYIPGDPFVNLIFPVQPGGRAVTPAARRAEHPLNPHFDWIQLRYFATGVNTSRLQIQFDHTETGDAPPLFIPEPSSLLLFGTGLLGLAWAVRRRRRLAV
jgi:hypothetical protein